MPTPRQRWRGECSAFPDETLAREPWTSMLPPARRQGGQCVGGERGPAQWAQRLPPWPAARPWPAERGRSTWTSRRRGQRPRRQSCPREGSVRQRGSLCQRTLRGGAPPRGGAKPDNRAAVSRWSGAALGQQRKKFRAKDSGRARATSAELPQKTKSKLSPGCAPPTSHLKPAWRFASASARKRQRSQSDCETIGSRQRGTPPPLPPTC